MDFHREVLRESFSRTPNIFFEGTLTYAQAYIHSFEDCPKSFTFNGVVCNIKLI